MKTRAHLQKNLVLCLVIGLALSAVFAMYLQPQIMLALDGFWAMCSAALR